MSCPTPRVGEIPGSPIQKLSLAVTVIFPIFVFSCWLYFYVNRSSYVYLRKRSFGLLCISCFGAVFPWTITALYDVIGPIHYPCGLYAFLVYISTPIVGAPVMVQGLVYLSEVSARTLAESGSPLKGSPRLSTLLAHLKVAFLGSRNKTDRLNNARFTRTYSFWILWVSITLFPYLLAYFIRLGSEPAWQNGCYGCFLGDGDFIALLAINTINWGLCVTVYSLRVRKRDSLRIIRQCLLAIGFPMPLLLISYALALSDPDGTYAGGGFNFTTFGLLAYGGCIYVITVQQVYNARKIKHKILLSDNVDRLDRFIDVMNDKELKAELRNYLHSELSSEILLFLDACEDVKSKFANSKSEGETEARAVYHMYVEKNRAMFEINLPSSIRDSITQKIKGDFDASIFEEAYMDVRNHLLRDGFPRFLRKLKKEEGKKRPPRRTITILTSRGDSTAPNKSGSESELA